MGFARNIWNRSGLGDRLKPVATTLVSVLLLAWGIEIVDWLFLGQALNKWGTTPRTVRGLVGIPITPLLHGGFGHLAANSVPLFVLGMVVGLRGVRTLVETTCIVTLIGGAGVWLFARSVTHIGASGVVFGYFGFLIAQGFFDKRVRSLLVGVGVLVLYGGLFWGVLPQSDGVSWEGHLFGLLAGVLAARVSANGMPEVAL